MNYIDQAMSISDSFALNATTLGNVPGFVIRPLLKHRKNLLLAARECRNAGCEEEVMGLQCRSSRVPSRYYSRNSPISHGTDQRKAAPDSMPLATAASMTVTNNPRKLKMTTKTAIAALFFTVLLVIMFAMIFEPVNPIDPYCEMVQIYIDSNGEFGWPDYRKNYHETCPAIPLVGGNL